jgi:hypothetical protein
LKNLRSVTFAFDFSTWVGDNYVWGETPKKIKQWAESHYPYRYSFHTELDNSHKDAVFVRFNHVPKNFITYTMLSMQGVSVIDQVEYCPIHPDVLPLFDFGENE